MGRKYWLSYEELDYYYPFIDHLQKEREEKDSFLLKLINDKIIAVLHPAGKEEFDARIFLKTLNFNRVSLDTYFINILQMEIESIKNRRQTKTPNSEEQKEADDIFLRNIDTFEAWIAWMLSDEEPISIDSLVNWIVNRVGRQSAPSVAGEENNHTTIGLSKKEVKERRFRQAEAFVVKMRENAELGGREIAQQLKGHYPDLSYAEIGRLLPATPGCPGGYDCQKSQGQRLLGVKK